MPLRLGDELDDYCIRCRRLTNHEAVSLVEGEAAKVRCRSCHVDHDYRHEQAPPTKKELQKAALFGEVLANAQAPGDAPAEEPEEVPASKAKKKK
ncbi:MAG: hypothetical protein WDO18_09465 [Acidobacteriota bacterium]